MEEFFGDLERLAADLYPYRWAIGAGVLVALAAIGAWGYRQGWHLVLWERRILVSAVGIPLLTIVGFIGYDLGSPLFTNKTVEEEFPFAFAAEVPSDMDREHVEKIMEGIAQVDMEVDEEMPKDMSGDKPSAISPTATAGPAREPTAEPTAVAVARGTATLLSSGMFHDQDAFHRGSGTAGIYRGPDGSLLLRLENLDVTNGPDLHVLLSTHPDPQRREDLESAKYIDLGKLKGNRGTQNYEIPDDVDVGAQATVIIYCLPFHVIFSVASLLEEELPLTSAAVLPSGTSREDAEKVMVEAAKVDEEVDEGVPAKMGTVKPLATPVPTATPQPTATVTAKPVAVKLKSGSLRDQDAFHKGSGTATIFRGPDGSLLLRLENLDVTNGPDLHVILSAHPNPKNRSDLKSAGFVDLGKLKGNRGNQNYEIPADVDVGAQDSVVIYCMPFHVIFSVASLSDAG